MYAALLKCGAALRLYGDSMSSNEPIIVVQPSNPATSIVAYTEWGMGPSDVGINIRRDGTLVCSVDLTYTEALALAQQLTEAAVAAKYLDVGYKLAQMPQ